MTLFDHKFKGWYK